MAKKIDKARVLAALEECSTIQEATDKAGLTRRTLYNYIAKDPEFGRAYVEILERKDRERAEAALSAKEIAFTQSAEMMLDQNNSYAVRTRAAAVFMRASEALEITSDQIISILRKRPL